MPDRTEHGLTRLLGASKALAPIDRTFAAHYPPPFSPKQELLLRYGAPLASVDAAGQTALHLAVYEGQVACARALLDARAPCPEVVAEDDYGAAASGARALCPV